MKDLHLIVCGSRHFDNRRIVYKVLDRIHKERGINLIIEGGATGADRLAREWAKSRGVLFKTFEADWTTHGRAAGPIRNREMLAWPYLSGVVAFPGGKGTADMVRQARTAAVTVWVPVK
jgi:predicted Rossmann-fold nucleotide-binding protein